MSFGEGGVTNAYGGRTGTKIMDKVYGQRQHSLHEDENKSMLIVRAVSGCINRRTRRRPIIVIGKGVREGVDVSGVGGSDQEGRVVHA